MQLRPSAAININIIFICWLTRVSSRIVLVWLVCVRLCSRCGRQTQSQVIYLATASFQADVLPGWVPKISHSGRVYTLEINRSYFLSHVFFLHSRRLVVTKSFSAHH